MSWIAEFVSSGRMVELIIVFILIEIVALLAWRSRSPRLLRKPALLGNLLAGLFLMIAVRAALGDWPWQIVATSLSAAFVAHLADLRGRIREAMTPAIGPELRSATRGPAGARRP